jgi:CO/xanthine dehydrogenase FAD-binding subunit
MESKDRENAMITFDFDYYKPDSIEEAVKVYKQMAGLNKTVIYYAGGTEIISLARINKTHFDAVIDIKGIPELNILEFRGDKLIIGAAVSLTKICDSGLFPFLGSVCRRTADHTARDKITIGGNICGKTPYKEAILPLLLADGEVITAGMSGMMSSALVSRFNKELMLDNGEFLVQVTVDKKYTDLPYVSIKKTRNGNPGYPLVSAAAMESDKHIRIAFSGLCSYPFRSQIIENDLNNFTASIEERTENIMKHLPEPLINDIIGSAEYRDFVTRNAINEIAEKLGGIK